MTQVTNQAVIITIKDHEPKERKNWLIEALAASLRWYACCPQKTNHDADNVHVITDLITTLSQCED